MSRDVWWGHGYAGAPPSAPEIPLDRKLRHEVFRQGHLSILQLPADPLWLLREGQEMRHCLSIAFQEYAAAQDRGEIQLYSVIDNRTGRPVVDIELALTRPTYSDPVDEPTITQVRGVANQCPPDPEFLPILGAFFEWAARDLGWRLYNPDNPNFDGQLDGLLVMRAWHDLSAPPPSR